MSKIERTNLSVSDIEILARMPRHKVFYLRAVTQNRNTKGQWQCIGFDGNGRWMKKWCELPELDRLLNYGQNSLSPDDLSQKAYLDQKTRMN